MAIFIVTTGEDVVDPDDGLLSLREAVRAAEENEGFPNSGPLVDDVIRFAEGVTHVTLEIDDVFRESTGLLGRRNPISVNQVTLSSFERRAELVIDGDIDGDGVADVTIDGQGETFHFVVLTPLTLRNLALVNGAADYDDDATFQPISDSDAAGSIHLLANRFVGEDQIPLLLENVHFENNRAVGARGRTGADGVDGADGANGANGRNATFSSPATAGRNGADGGNATPGGDGGDGGDAAGAILAEARVVLRDVTFGPGHDALGGRNGVGGRGGRGGDGGDGGDGGNGWVLRHSAKPGGDGGDGGDAAPWGLGGAAGAASHLMLAKDVDGDGVSDGRFVFETPVAIEERREVGQPVYQHTSNSSGGGAGGQDGKGGSLVGADASDGRDGANGRNVVVWANVEEHPRYVSRTDPWLLHLGDESHQRPEVVDVLHRGVLDVETVAEGGTLTLTVHRTGLMDRAMTVGWRLAGPDAARLAEADRAGELTIPAEAESASVEIAAPAFDGRAEGPRPLEVVLTPAEPGADGPTARVAQAPGTVTLEDGDGAGDDVLRGTRRADEISAGKGDDVVRGRGGKDSLAGEQGHDRLFGQNGRDDLDGGGGRDRLVGGRGHDEAHGGGGRDRLIGGGGRDDLSGDGGRDRLIGGAGRDMLDGGRGADVFKGGGGRDVFRFDARDGRDRILDWQDGRDSIAFASGASRFKDLRIRDKGDDALVVHEGGRILVEDAAGALRRDDFDFA